MRKYRCLYFIFVILPLLLSEPKTSSNAQSLDSTWSDFVNISHTSTASTYPCITSDLAGYVHVLWSEDVGGNTKNLLTNPQGTPSLDIRGKQINYLTTFGNTLYYTRWDGQQWLQPIDVQIAQEGYIEYPEAVVDPNGILNVVWIGGFSRQAKLYYSRVLAREADSVRAWSRPMVLAEPVNMAYYMTDITADKSGGLHIIYSIIGDAPGIYITNSFDKGMTWSDPIHLFSTSSPTGEENGSSTVKLNIDEAGRLHATWSYYDVTGNGKTIFYSQSRDYGKTWTEPFPVANWEPGWYEVDWLNVGVIGDEIHFVWEGGEGPYLNERISEDDGKSWGEAYQILPNLVGENGFASLVVDSADQLHMLVVLRGDGYTLSHGIWYTSWIRDRWNSPILLSTADYSLYTTAGYKSAEDLTNILRGTFTGNGLRYPSSAVTLGNELFVVVVNEWDGDIYASHTTLLAPYIAPQTYPEPTSTPVYTVTSAPTQASLTPTWPSIPSSNRSIQNIGQGQFNIVMLSALPAVVLLFLIVICFRKYRR